jgi:hypothetical protein
MTVAAYGEPRTYRGSSLDEVLPRIREELGADAVILREREGVVGGLGGFFGKRCVEVEAAPRWTMPPEHFVPAMPATAAAGLYEIALEEPDEPETRFMEVLLDRAAAFDEMLVPASDGPDDGRASQHEDEATTVRPATRREREREPGADGAAGLREEYDVRLELAQVGMAPDAIELIVGRAVTHQWPFTPAAPLRDVVRRTLGDGLVVPVGWEGRRTIAFVGAAGDDAPDVAANVAGAYAGAGARVALVSLGGGPQVARLAADPAACAAELHVAHDAHDVERIRERVKGADLVVALAPPLPDGDRWALVQCAELLVSLAPDETHVVLPARTEAVESARLVDTLDALFSVTGLVLSGFDGADSRGGTIGLAASRRLVVRWLAEGAGRASVIPACGACLAEVCLP